MKANVYMSIIKEGKPITNLKSRDFIFTINGEIKKAKVKHIGNGNYTYKYKQNKMIKFIKKHWLKLILINAIVQYIICWIIYVNWFSSHITYCTMIESNSFIAMLFVLPLFVWIPILPIILVINL